VPVLDVPLACGTLAALSAVLFRADSVVAYVGPGAGLELVGYALTLAMYGLTALSAVLLWPVYVLLRRIRGGKNKSAPASPSASVPGEASGTSCTEP
jgi:hypothetical protein